MTRHARSSVEEYLRLEAEAAERHEYRDGEIVAMAGGSPEHSLIIANLIREIGNRLKGGPCRVYDSNLRIRVPRSTLYTYPDLSVICGEPQFDPQDRRRTTILNPRVLVEVLSERTEAYDRGDKLRRYLEIESLQEYVLLSQSSPWAGTVRFRLAVYVFHAFQKKSRKRIKTPRAELDLVEKRLRKAAEHMRPIMSAKTSTPDCPLFPPLPVSPSPKPAHPPPFTS